MAKTFPVWVVPVFVVLMGVRKVRAGARKVASVFRKKPRPEPPEPAED